MQHSPLYLLATVILVLAAPLEAHSEAPHSTAVAPGGSSAALPAQNINPGDSYSAFEPGTPVDGAPPVEVENQPPHFLYSASPAVLIPVDGNPVLHDSGAAELDRVINSRAPLFRSRRDGRFHVAIGEQWYSAHSLEGDWSAETPSDSLRARLETAKNKAGAEIDEIMPPAPHLRVYASSEPTELLQTSGNAALTPIGNGRLLYVTNTPNDLFFYSPEQQYYVLASGRWYRSFTLGTGWAYVDARSLPAEFAQIPLGHPKAHVLASVPGTDSAQAALSNAAAPKIATVDRGATATALQYDGVPDFAPIPGTALAYARNASEPVIEVSPGRFMAVENGVWFEGPTALGPWLVATSVPPAMYTIPPSSPVYYVSYVYVYDYGPHWVRAGYLPGYLGSYISPEGVVVYGTGYRYHPWIGHVWYGHPVTYGLGVSWGFGNSWAFGGSVFHPYRPYWGPWRWEHYHHVAYAPGPVYLARHNFYRGWGHQAAPEHFERESPPARPWNYSLPYKSTPLGANTPRTWPTRIPYSSWNHHAAPTLSRPTQAPNGPSAPYRWTPSAYPQARIFGHVPTPPTTPPRYSYGITSGNSTPSLMPSREYHSSTMRTDLHGEYHHGSTDHAHR